MHESANADRTAADASESEPLAYTVPQAAKALSLGVRTVWSLVHTDRLRSFKVGRSVRVSRQALVEYIEQQEKAA